MQKIILDTNVLISALISPDGIPCKIIDELVIEKVVSICTSEIIVREYFDVINKDKFKQHRSFYVNAEILLGYIEEIAEKFTPTAVVDLLKAKTDNKFLELAFESKADYLITGNIKDFSLQKAGVTKILSPSEYWRKYKP